MDDLHRAYRLSPVLLHASLSHPPSFRPGVKVSGRRKGRRLVRFQVVSCCGTLHIDARPMQRDLPPNPRVPAWAGGLRAKTSGEWKHHHDLPVTITITTNMNITFTFRRRSVLRCTRRTSSLLHIQSWCSVIRRQPCGRVCPPKPCKNSATAYLH